MELIFLFLPLLPLLAVFGLYKSDPDGWKKTSKRISSYVRASLEFKKDKDKMIAPLTSNEWEDQFSGNILETPAEKKPHYIVKTTWYRAYDGEEWPQWFCKCGEKGYVPIVNGIKYAVDTARHDAESHVTERNKYEEERERYKIKGVKDREW